MAGTEADFGASGQVSSKLFISIIDEGGRYAPSSSSLPCAAKYAISHTTSTWRRRRPHQRLFTVSAVAALYFADYGFFSSVGVAMNVEGACICMCEKIIC